MNFDKLNLLSEKLKNLRPLSQTEMRRLSEEFMIENTYDSNAIEGNTLTLRETALILQEGITIAEKPLKDHLEAIGHKDAFLYSGIGGQKRTSYRKSYKGYTFSGAYERFRKPRCIQKTSRKNSRC